MREAARGAVITILGGMGSCCSDQHRFPRLAASGAGRRWNFRAAMVSEYAQHIEVKQNNCAEYQRANHAPRCRLVKKRKRGWRGGMQS
jgi:hypothetical protein